MALHSVQPSLFKDFRSTFERLEKFISDTYFTDCNLRSCLYPESLPFGQLFHCDFGQERVGFEQAKSAVTDSKKSVSVGFSFGPTWSTHWFFCTSFLPESWVGKKVILRWNAGCEATVWTGNGRPVQGLSGDWNRTDFTVSDGLKSEERQQKWFIECAANELFGAGEGGMILPPKSDRTFILKTAEFAVLDENVRKVLLDLEVLIGTTKCSPYLSHRKFQALYVGNHIVNLLCHDKSEANLKKAHDLAVEFFSQRNGETAFQIFAVANSHIDTAWLWPYAETRRKVARSWSTALRVCEKYPEMVFAVSQAQQIAWLREDYPIVYDEIVVQGRRGCFVGVGGVWVEMDGLVPSGESFVRQVLYGQKEFRKTFAKYCDIFWLPDTFGYSGQLPQIMTLGKMDKFLTQKISWNFVNKFPHHTFWWRGIDGTEVLSHFPPTDTYCSTMSVEECLKTSNQFADKGRSSAAMMLYGYGDGGGGPTEEMMERIRRLKDVDGLPKVKSASPVEYFAHVTGLCVWSGELYLELHNGTYTTQANTKRNNRECEFLLRDCEFLSVFYWISAGQKIRNWECEWKKVLLNQFHDVLPGSSIGEVYADASKLYDEVRESCNHFLQRDEEGERCLLNSLSWSRIVEVEGKFYKLPPMSLSKMSQVEYVPKRKVEVWKGKDEATVVLENGILKAVVDLLGRVSSLSVISDDLMGNSSALFDGICPGKVGNEFAIYDDVPLYWDAWDVMDYHLETRMVQDKVDSALKVVEKGPEVGKVEFEMRIGERSKLKQEIVLRADQAFLEFRTEVNWHENHKFLKVEFPLNVHCDLATYEIQFGHLKRPTHRNWECEWKKVLLNQFHDVLPGSSIGEVYADASKLYDEVRESCNHFLQRDEEGERCLLNSLSWSRIVEVEGKFYKLPPMSLSKMSQVEYVPKRKVEVWKGKDEATVVLENGILKAVVDLLGRVSSLSVISDDLMGNSSALFDGICPGKVGNEFAIYDDVPLYWDAWDVMDYHLETRMVQDKVDSALKVVEKGPEVGKVEFEMRIGERSKLKQEIVLRADQAFLEFRTEVNWHENHKFLKVEFPLNVHCDLATYEIQFGHLKRPTHRNTSWDAARYEVCGHKWVDLAEHGFGVAVLNDSKYGYSCYGNQLSMSLLRSPKAPDPNADMGIHRFTYALMPHFGSFQTPFRSEKSVIQAAYELNIPARVISCDINVPNESIYLIDHPAVFIEAVKGGEDGNVILRLYEAYGGKARCCLRVTRLRKVREVYKVNLLEESLLNGGDGSVVLEGENRIGLIFKPFEIVSLLIIFSEG